MPHFVYRTRAIITRGLYCTFYPLFEFHLQGVPLICCQVRMIDDLYQIHIIYRTRAIITRGLYTFEVQKRFFKELFS